MLEELMEWVTLPLISAIAFGFFEALTRAEENYRKGEEHWWFITEIRKKRRKNYVVIMIFAASISIGFKGGMELNKLFQ